jgi:hypothetical protein
MIEEELGMKDFGDFEKWDEPLTPEEKAILKGHMPEPIARVIKGIPVKYMTALYRSLGFKDLSKYNQSQQDWVRDWIWLAGVEKGAKPTEDDVMNEMSHHYNYERFRFSYSALRPEEVKISNSPPDKFLRLATNYFMNIFLALGRDVN